MIRFVPFYSVPSNDYNNKAQQQYNDSYRDCDYDVLVNCYTDTYIPLEQHYNDNGTFEYDGVNTNATNDTNDTNDTNNTNNTNAMMFLNTPNKINRLSPPSSIQSSIQLSKNICVIKSDQQACSNRRRCILFLSSPPSSYRNNNHVFSQQQQPRRQMEYQCNRHYNETDVVPSNHIEQQQNLSPNTLQLEKINNAKEKIETYVESAMQSDCMFHNSNNSSINSGNMSGSVQALTDDNIKINGHEYLLLESYYSSSDNVYKY